MSEDFPIVIVSIIKRHDDVTCRRTANKVRKLDPAGFVIVAPFDIIESRIRDAVRSNSTIEVVADEDHNLITVISTNAYFAQHALYHEYEASNLYTALDRLLKQFAGSYAEV